MVNNNPRQTMPGWMTRAEVASALGVSKTMVRKLERSGALPSVRNGGCAYYDAAAVEELRQEREAPVAGSAWQ